MCGVLKQTSQGASDGRYQMETWEGWGLGVSPLKSINVDMEPLVASVSYTTQL